MFKRIRQVVEPANEGNLLIGRSVYADPYLVTVLHSGKGRF
jgi:hypothetical protein